MDRRSVDTDIVVVGAGPAGSSAAIACALRGLRVVLIERDDRTGDRPGETLHPGIEPLLAQLGFDASLPLAVGARHGGLWIEWGGPRRFEPFGGAANDPWRGFQVRRNMFERLLIDRARSVGVEVLSAAASAVLVSGARACGVSTAAGPLRAQFVIDASGRARWLARKLALGSSIHSPRLVARYGYANGSCPERDAAPLLRGDASGWTWTARVWPGTYQWTRLSFDDRSLPAGWVPEELRGLATRGLARGADVTWRLAEMPAGPGWFVVGDAAATLDPTSSHGVLKAVMSGIMAGHLAAAILAGRAPGEGAARAYRGWLARWFAIDATRLSQFYRHLGAPGFAPHDEA